MAREKRDVSNGGPESRQAANSEQQPEVYAIQRGRAGGWTLDRRSLLAAAAAAAAPRSVEAAACTEGAFSHQAKVTGLAITPDGRLLISLAEEPASSPDTIKLWSLPDGALLKALPGAYAMALSPDGTLLASGTRLTLTTSPNDFDIKIWSLPDGVLLKALPGHTRRAGALVFSPDGKLLVSTAWDLTIKVWSMPAGDLLKTLQGWQKIVKSLAISPDGAQLAVGLANGEVELRSLPGGELQKTLPTQSRSVETVDYSPDGRLLLSGSSNGVEIWSLPGGELLKAVPTSYSVYAVAISPDGRYFATGYHHSTLMEKIIWVGSLPDGALHKMLKGHPGDIDALCFSPDGELLASGGDGKSIRLWSFPDGKPLPPCLVDPLASTKQSSAVRYTLNQASYTLPCGSSLPSGAVCTCNCVPGTWVPVSGCSTNPVYYYPN